MWGEWKYPHERPELGDYIQVEGKNLFTREPIRFEGIVNGVSDKGFDIIGFKGFVLIKRWRKLKPPEIEANYQQKSKQPEKGKMKWHENFL